MACAVIMPRVRRSVNNREYLSPRVPRLLRLASIRAIPGPLLVCQPPFVLELCAQPRSRGFALVDAGGSRCYNRARFTGTTTLVAPLGTAR